MQERVSISTEINTETGAFLKSFVDTNILRYKTIWVRHQALISRLGKDFDKPEVGYPFPLNMRKHATKQSVSEELEFRGFTLQKFMSAATEMVEKEEAIDLPSFLIEDLADWKTVHSTKGTIFDKFGKQIKFEDRNMDIEKSGGVLRIFLGEQIALFIQYGSKEKPTKEIVEAKLIPTKLIESALVRILT